MRMHMRRFTRLTNAFSKKAENHIHAIALHFMFYNFCRIHKTLRITPAMAAGVTDHVWDMAEIVGVIDTWEEAAQIEHTELQQLRDEGANISPRNLSRPHSNLGDL
jgi:hypothetical protein